jgi:sugar phosphate isomerase/epimerase
LIVAASSFQRLLFKEYAMKLSVMTLGCPGWDLDTLLKNAKAYGYDGIDFRGLLNDLDITKTPAFTSELVKTHRRISDAGLATSGISSSIAACDPAKREANLDEAKRTIPVALELGCKNVRIFGGGPVETIGHEEAAKIGRDCIGAILALPGADKLSWNFETHDHWVKARNCTLLLDVIANPAFGALWDLGHTKRVGGESPEETWAAIGPRVRYCHVKDAVEDAAAGGDGWRYVLPGTGVLPLAAAIGLLRQHGYDGWLLFEHEKRWHPTLPEPEVAFPAFVQWVRPLIGKA